MGGFKRSKEEAELDTFLTSIIPNSEEGEEAVGGCDPDGEAVDNFLESV